MSFKYEIVDDEGFTGIDEERELGDVIGLLDGFVKQVEELDPHNLEHVANMRELMGITFRALVDMIPSGLPPERAIAISTVLSVGSVLSKSEDVDWVTLWPLVAASVSGTIRSMKENAEIAVIHTSHPTPRTDEELEYAIKQGKAKVIREIHVKKH